MHQQEIELRLWEYIDGLCDEATHTYISGMIACDARWDDLHKKLLALHNSAQTQMDIEQPSLRFAKNVMEVIDHTNMARATKTYINPAVIKIIGSIFIISIVLLLAYAISLANDMRASGIVSASSIPDWESDITAGNFLKILGSFNVIAGLLLADSMLRKKRSRKQLLNH